MNLERPRIELVLFHDVLCSWCLLADARLRWLTQRELKDHVSLSYRAYPTRQGDSLPTARERRVLAKHYRRVSRSSEGHGVVSDLWTSDDPPLSTLPPLLALEAALHQGQAARETLWHALRQAAFWQGVNVSRRDVIIEIAEHVGLDVPALLERMDAPEVSARVVQDHEEAEERGINGVPALLLRPSEAYSGSPEWIVSGCRDIWEYREVVYRFHDKLESLNPERLLH